MNKEKIVLSITQLNNQAKSLLEDKFSYVWVEGEVSTLRKYSSGHIYFTLKDPTGEISCVLFNHNAKKITFIPLPVFINASLCSVKPFNQVS